MGETCGTAQPGGRWFETRFAHQRELSQRKARGKHSSGLRACIRRTSGPLHAGRAPPHPISHCPQQVVIRMVLGDRNRKGASRGSRRTAERNIFPNDLPENGRVAQALDGIEDFDAGQTPVGVVVPGDPLRGGPRPDGDAAVPPKHPPPHIVPALRALGGTGIRPPDFRRSFIAVHIEAGPHPQQVQDRLGHSHIPLTMDVYGKIAGQMTLTAEQEARLDALAARALPAALPDEPGTNRDAVTVTDSNHKPTKDPDAESAA